MTDAFAPAIAALERKLEELERKANELRAAINLLCAEGGNAPRYPEGGGGGGRTPRAMAQIKSDRFYGKPLATGVREILEMRKAGEIGPATPREIFDALKQGGFQFEAKNDDIALVSLRATLRKNNRVFHRLPSGTYGLLSWYPNAKPPKDNGGSPSSSSMGTSMPEDLEDEEVESEAAATSDDAAAA
jgi:hypothetical protein